MEPRGIWGSLDPFYEAGDVMGRKVANSRFLDALIRLDPFEAYHFFPADVHGRRRLEAGVRALDPELLGTGRVAIFHRSELPAKLAEVGYALFHQSDCVSLQPHLAALRNRISPNLFPITGTTHSLSRADYGHAFLNHLSPTTTPRDAVVATSRAGRRAVLGFFDGLRRSLGLAEPDYPAPRVARIPLGVDPADFTPSEDRRRAARDQLGLAPETRALLVFGRLSHHSKMDVLPLLRAVQRLRFAGIDPAGLRLILAGWMEADDDYVETLTGLAGNLGLPVNVARNPDEEAKLRLFAAADLFVSLADNPQETFGLTILEASAAGLPVVASDYDGYRDLVAEGETGFLIPSLGPPETRLINDLSPILFDNQYHLLLSQQTAIDVAMLARRLDALVRDPGAARAMGEAGRRRVNEEFTWDHAAKRHVELWDELAGAEVDEERARAARHPLHVDYARVFASYPTHTLGTDDFLRLSPSGDAVYRGREFPLIYGGVSALVNVDVLRRVLFAARKGATAGRLMGVAAQLLGHDKEGAAFLVLWALKHDFLERIEPGG